MAVSSHWEADNLGKGDLPIILLHRCEAYTFITSTILCTRVLFPTPLHTILPLPPFSPAFFTSTDTHNTVLPLLQAPLLSNNEYLHDPYFLESRKHLRDIQEPRKATLLLISWSIFSLISASEFDIETLCFLLVLSSAATLS